MYCMKRGMYDEIDIDCKPFKFSNVYCTKLEEKKSSHRKKSFLCPISLDDSKVHSSKYEDICKANFYWGGILPDPIDALPKILYCI